MISWSVLLIISTSHLVIIAESHQFQTLYCMIIKWKNGSMFTIIMSAIRITLWYRSKTACRISSYPVWNCFGVNCTVFIFNEPVFGLKLPSDTRMSSQVMGKFYSGLFVTMLTKSRILGSDILSYVFISNSTQEV